MTTDEGQPLENDMPGYEHNDWISEKHAEPFLASYLPWWILGVSGIAAIGVAVLLMALAVFA